MKKLLIIFLLLKQICYSELENKFSIELAEQRMRQATYICPAPDNNGNIYLVTGEETFTDNKIYVLKYDINSLKVIDSFYYESTYSFTYGEAYFISDNNKDFLFVSTFFTDTTIGEREFVNIGSKSCLNQRESSNIHGYKRDFKKADHDYYYLISFKRGGGDFLLIEKMAFTSSGDSPDFHLIKDANVGLPYQAMLSCDLTEDKYFILCAYFTEDNNVNVNDYSHVTISAFNSALENIDTKVYEEWEYWPPRPNDPQFRLNDVFIKIVYLKDNSNFIIVNKHTDPIMRLRYINYNNNLFEDKLGDIVGSEYLDVENTQKSGHYGANDIIALDSNIIVKVFGDCNNNYLIITIIHFFNNNRNEPAMTIKIYNMYPDGFSCPQRPRLAKVKNSFIVCLSADIGGLKTGFFLVNFPNVINQTLENDDIAVSDLIRLENNLFNLNIKLKVLEDIPPDLILVSNLKSEKVKKLELYDDIDTFTLRQFRISEMPFTLKFQAIAKGIDTGYSYAKAYNIEGDINESHEYEGRIGELTIDFQNRFNDYYYLSYDMDLCTNLKPVNFYLDDTDNTFKPCNSSCDECTKPINETFMNCIACKENYSMTEDSRSCYKGEIDNYYLDIDQLIYKRCHPNCLRCYSKPLNNTYMNCKSCQYNYFMTEDTNSCHNIILDNYYLDVRTLRRCHRNCYLCFGSPLDRFHMNCKTCQNNLYMTEDTNSCYRRVIDNYYLDNNTLKRCPSNCLDCYSIEDNVTFYNCLACYEDWDVSADRETCHDFINKNFQNIFDLNISQTKDFYYELQMDQNFLQFTSTDYLKQNNYKNKTSINLGDCENILKKAYDIPENDSLYILIIDIEQKGMKIPKIEYEVYKIDEPNHLIKLNLNLCKNNKIEISIPVAINGSIDLYNSSSGYYNNLCYTTTSIYGTDICLDDRREEFINNNLTLCEENCILIEYDNIYKNAKCSCDVKVNLPSVKEAKFDKEKLKNNFIDINNIGNIQCLKCYKMVFRKNNIKINYGFYIYLFLFLLYFLCLFLFYFKFYYSYFSEVELIFTPEKNDNNLNHIETDDKNENNFNFNQIKQRTKIIKIKKKIKILKNKTTIKSDEENKKSNNDAKENKGDIILNNKNNDSKINNEIIYKEEGGREKETDKGSNKEKNIINNKPNNKIMDYTDSELNDLSYKEAIKNDKRTFLQYYIALLKANHLILFSFYPNKDYNSQIIKIFLFFFFLGIDLAFNAFFITDLTIQQIYKDKGSFNFVYQIPAIIYSTLISFLLNIIIKYFSLTGDDINEVKEEKRKEPKNFLAKAIKIVTKIKIKFAVFYILAPLILLFLGFYICCFCGVYNNSQLHLIKDALFSLLFSVISPFFTLLLPGILRISALRSDKKNKKWLYKISKVLEMFL